MDKTSIKIGAKEFVRGERTYVMGIVNVSPDSFSGDGITDINRVVDQVRQFCEDGADIIDVGGESTRPNPTPVTLEEEIDRVIPVIRALANNTDIPLSVDTTKPEVARLALKAGAAILNDQSGLKQGDELAELAAAAGAPIILMSNQRDKGGYDAAIKRDTAAYDDVISEVSSSLAESRHRALLAGIPDEKIILDPGIGFGKTWQQDLELIRRLGEIKTTENPLLIGPSRKSCIGMALNLPVDQRLEGTAAAIALAIANGADIIRVHDVREMSRVSRMCDAILKA